MLTRASFVIPGDYYAGGIVRYIVPVRNGTSVAIITENADLTSSTYLMSIQAMAWIIPRVNG